MELADVTDSKSVGLITRAGSTPATGTKKIPSLLGRYFLCSGNSAGKFKKKSTLAGAF